MCIAFVAIRQHPVFLLIVATNRDEYYSRPAERAYFWSHHPDVLAGIDQKSHGTWGLVGN